MAKRSILRFGGAISAAVLATVAVPAPAAKWMVIGEEPESSPNRSVYVTTADDEWIFSRFVDGFDKVNTGRSLNLTADLEANSIYTINVYQVFESAGGTDFISYTLDFKCREGLVSIPKAISYDRTDKQSGSGSSGWMKVPNNWISKAEMIACRSKNWQSARTSLGEGGPPASMGKGKKNKQSAVSFASLGMEYLGEASILRPTDVVRQVWTKRWTDAVQHPYVIKRTAAEQAELDAKNVAVKGKITGMMTEQKKWTDISFSVRAKAERMGGKYGPDMSSIGGITEEQVITRWGAPAGYIERSGVRTLTYYFSDTQYGVDYVPVDVISQNGNVVGQTTQNKLSTSQRQCSRTLHLQEGGAVTKAFRVFDFDVSC